jgi:hypothetical protein
MDKCAIALPKTVVRMSDQMQMEFVVKCVAIKLRNTHPPVSSRTLLATLCAGRYDQIASRVLPDDGAKEYECIQATCALAVELDMDIYRLADVAQLICRRATSRTMGLAMPYIRGLQLARHEQ